jgi:hypothetical protein
MINQQQCKEKGDPAPQLKFKEKLTARALEANEDIKTGRFYTREETVARFKERLKLPIT